MDQEKTWRRPTKGGPTLDMTPDGHFAETRVQGTLPFSTKVMGIALLVAVLTAAGAIALLALWLAFTLIPIAIGAAAIAYGVYRFRLWKARSPLFGGQRDIFRP